MDTYISDKQNAERFGISRATVWRWVATRAFPKPIKFSSGCTRWRLEDVEKWEAQISKQTLPDNAV